MIVPCNVKVSHFNNTKGLNAFRMSKGMLGWDVLKVLADTNSMDVKEFAMKHEASVYDDAVVIAVDKMGLEETSR